MEKTDETLLSDYAARGDREALAELVRRRWPEAYRISLRVLGDEAAAEDAAQEAFVNVIRGAKRFEKGRPFGPWFGAIVMNSARGRARSERTRRRHEEEAVRSRGEGASVPEGEKRLLESEVEVHLGKLPFDLRFPVVLHYYENRSYEEVASVLGCQKSTAHARIGRGLERLRESLAGASLALTLPAVEYALQSRARVHEAARVPAAPSVALLEKTARRAALGALATKVLAAVLVVGLATALVTQVASEPLPAPAGGVSSVPERAPAKTPAAPDLPVAALDTTSLPPPAPAPTTPEPGAAAANHAKPEKPTGPALMVEVRDANGSPVPGSEVTFVDAKESERDDEAPDEPRWYSAKRTDEKGQLRIDSEEKSETKEVDGTINVRIYDEALATGRSLYVFARRDLEEGIAGPIELREPREIPVRVRLRKPAEPRPRRGTLLAVVTRNGAPLRSAPVKGEWRAPRGNGSRNVPVGPIDGKTDDEGRFVVPDLRPARYDFSVKAEDGAFATFSLEIEADKTTHKEIAVTESSAVEGRLVLAPGLQLEDVNSLNGYRKGNHLSSVDGETLPDGRYRFEHLEPGVYEVDVLLNRGFANSRATFEAKASGVEQGPEIKVGFGADVRGRARDRQGNALVGFKSVWATGDGFNVSADLDADGAFTFKGVRAGTYGLKIELQGKDLFDKGSFDRVVNTKLVVADAGISVDMGDLRFPVDENPWRLEGVVLDADGKPVEGADIELVRPGGWPLTTTKTDASGRFTVSEEKPGTVHVAARKFDLVSAPLVFETASGKVATAELRLATKTGRISGRFIVSADLASNLKDFSAIAESESQDGGNHPFACQSLALDAEGRFRFEKLPPGKYAVSIISVTDSATVEVREGAESEVTLDLSEATELVKVAVLGELPERHGQIHLSFDGRAGKAGGRLVHGIEDGKTEFHHVAPGRFVAEAYFAESSNTRLYARQEGQVSTGQPASVTIEWPERATTGRVRGVAHARTGGALVWAIGSPVSCYRMIETDGTFLLTGLPEGDYQLFVSADEPPAGAVGKTLRVVAGGEVEVEVSERN
jgi:RNA polymerase sigma-70 factor (ECF subfamily)